MGSTTSEMDIQEKLLNTLTTPPTENVHLMTNSLKLSAWVSSACSNTASTEEMSGSTSARKMLEILNFQRLSQAGAMSMITVTCMPTSTPTRTLMVTLSALFAPNTTNISMLKQLKSQLTLMVMENSTTTTEPTNDDEEANLCILTLYNYLKQ